MRHYRFFSLLLILLLVVAVGGAIWYVTDHYRISEDKIFVEGNQHYSAAEIRELVMSGPLGDNSLYLSLKYKNRKITDVPFVDSITVTVPSADTIRIHVFEKALAGYVQYLDRYIYFDKDGYVVESSTVKSGGVPQVAGISYKSVEVGKQLGDGDDEIFTRTLDLTKLLDKYDLEVDRIYFHEDGKVTLYFGKIRVNLGTESLELEDKLMNLPEFLPHLEGKSGVLDMDTDQVDKGWYVFSADSE